MQLTAKILGVDNPNYHNSNFARNIHTGKLQYLTGPAAFNYIDASFGKINGSISKSMEFVNVIVCSNEPIEVGDIVLKGDRLLPISTSYLKKNAVKNKLSRVKYSGKNIPSDIRSLIEDNQMIISISTKETSAASFNKKSVEKDFITVDVYDQVVRLTNEIHGITSSLKYSENNSKIEMSDSFFNAKLSEYLQTSNHLLFRSTENLDISSDLKELFQQLSGLSSNHVEEVYQTVNQIKNHLNRNTNQFNIFNQNCKTMIKMEHNGNLGNDPELRFTKNGQPVCNFSLAHNDKNGSNTIWQDITAWGDMAKFVADTYRKGDWLAVEGSRMDNNYEKDGKKFTSTTLNASNIRTSKEVNFESFEVTNVKTRQTKNNIEVLELYAKNKSGHYSNFTITENVDQLKGNINLGDKLDIIGKPRLSTYFEKDGDKNIPKTRFDCTVTAIQNKDKNLCFVMEPPKVEEGKELPKEATKQFEMKQNSLGTKPGKEASSTQSKKSKRGKAQGAEIGI